MFLVQSTDDAGPQTLRQAILDSNAATPGPNLIDFNIPGAGAQTISLLSPLRALTTPVTIDGTSQGGPGYNGPPLIVLDGSNAGAHTLGLSLDAGGSTLKGLVIDNFGTDGIFVQSSNNVIAGNYIGVDSTGRIAAGNGLDGITISSGSNNTIGGTAAGTGNVISANGLEGLDINGPGSGPQGTLVQGNSIGTDVTGSAALGNLYSGIYINATGTTVGGTTVAARNLLSGNGQDGLQITSASGTLVQGNYIGTDVSGTVALGNGNDGLGMNTTGTTTIGGTEAGARNIFSGNANNGLTILGSGTTLVLGNYIGTNATGTAALANSGDGVYVYGNATIGGTTSGAGNLISGNTGYGVELSNTTGALVQGNYIGTNAAGTAALGNGSDGIRSTSPNGIIGGTATGAGNLISGNTGNGISGGGLVQGNYIGTDSTGTAALGNGGDGIFLNAGTSNTIGGTTTGARNIISGNTGHGVEILGSGTLVQGNYIGTNVSGTASVGNGGDGVFVHGTSTIGGTTAAARNLISGNTANGLELFTGAGTLVQGNYIGTDVTGTAALGNRNDGVLISANSITLGGTTAAARNLISGNTANGLELFGGASARVQGNYIGTDVNGTAALGNGSDGVAIHDGARSNIIGGTLAGAGNLISANTANGVDIFTTGASTFANLVQGNLIGTDVSGTAALGNAGNGVFVTNASGNTVGGTASGAGNLIANNGNDGVLVDTGNDDAIRRNLIFSSTNLGIELINNGNNNQPAPVLATAVATASSITISGSLTAAPDNYALDFFASPVANPSGEGEGRQLLGSVTESINSSGRVDFTVTFAVVVPVGQVVSATATSFAGNSSAFAQDVTVTGPSVPSGPSRPASRAIPVWAVQALSSEEVLIPAVATRLERSFSPAQRLLPGFFQAGQLYPNDPLPVRARDLQPWLVDRLTEPSPGNFRTQARLERLDLLGDNFQHEARRWLGEKQDLIGQPGGS